MSKRCFEVFGFWPPVTVDGRAVHAGRHIAAFVLTTTAMRAGQLIADKYPGVRIDQILHRAGREVINDEGGSE